MAALPVELIGLVASFLKSGPRQCGQLSLSTQHEGQAHLARLVRASKAVHEQCVPLLYEDCVVDNFASLAHALQDRADHPIRYARRLHFAVHPEPYLNLYHLVFASGGMIWQDLQVRSQGGERVPVLTAGLVNEMSDIAALSTILRDYQDAGKVMLPSLERVVLQADTFDLDARLKHIIGPALAMQGFRGTLPLFFLGHPAVQHYCQSGLYGPLAWNAAIVNVANPPTIVTFHLPVAYPELYPGCELPVILGATNRYVFGSYQSLVSCRKPADRPSAQMIVTQALTGLLHILQDTDRVLDKDPLHDRFTVRELAELGTEFKQTKLEIYGAIHYKVVTSWGEAANVPKEEWRKSESLALFQTELDQMVGEWKGQVVLKHREECPPCSACDLDCQEYWMAMDNDK